MRMALRMPFLKDLEISKRFLPLIPSVATLGKDFNRELVTRPGFKVFIHPCLYLLNSGIWVGVKNVRIKKEFLD